MKLSVIIPVFNEEKTLKKLLDKVINVKLDIEKEIIIVNDCSTDNSKNILKEYQNIVQKIIHHNTNQGKGGAIKTGIKYATGELIVVQDADLEYNPEELNNLIKPIMSKKAQVVYGSRFLENKGKKGSIFNYCANKFLTKLTNILIKQNLTDMETCYKVFKKEIIKDIEICENRFGFEPEITAKIAKKGINIYEMPISYNPRTKLEGKKINIKDGLRAIYCIWKYK